MRFSPWIFPCWMHSCLNHGTVNSCGLVTLIMEAFFVRLLISITLVPRRTLWMRHREALHCNIQKHLWVWDAPLSALQLSSPSSQPGTNSTVTILTLLHCFMYILESCFIHFCTQWMKNNFTVMRNLLENPLISM